MTFHDHFSARAADYARFRPVYPPALFHWLAEQCPRRTLAWDCGTGNGQAALGLAEHFQSVVATDPSRPQIENARPHPQVRYLVGTERDSGLQSGTADLVTAAQALHWFEVPAFLAEARRVLAPDGLLAVWCYGLHRVNPAIDAVFDRFYSGVVGPWWPSERRHVESGYRTLPFLREELASPALAIEASLNLDGLLAYVATWSAVGRYREGTGEDPLPRLAGRLGPVWGDAAVPRLVRWPISIRAGYPHRQG